MHGRYQFEVGFNCDNAAFGGGDPGPEIARILRKIADEIVSRPLPKNRYDEISEGGPVRDVNGNKVGYWGLLMEDVE